MRILYFHQYFTTPSGTGGTRSYEMARALVANGHHVHMVCGNTSRNNSGLDSEFIDDVRQGTVDGIRITELKLDYSNYDSLPLRARKFMKMAFFNARMVFKEPHDLVFATSTPLTASIPGILSRWIRRKRFVFEVRDLWPELPREMGVVKNPVALTLLSALEWLSYRSAHACIGLSPGIVEGIRRRSAPQLPTTMIPNGCDTDFFNSQPTQKVELPGVDSNDFVALFAGAHGNANGLDAVLDAAAVLASKQVKEIKFVFIGDGKLKPHLQKRVEDEGLCNCVFVDSVPKKELASYMARANVCLMTLRNVPAFYYGTSPNKFFDYIAYGRPVITNYPGWIADMILEEKLGAAVPPDNPEAFADALLALSESSEELSNMGSRAQAYARLKFDRPVLSEKFVTFLEEQTAD